MAQVEGTSTLSAENEPSVVDRFVALFVRKGDAWRIAEIRDLPAPAEDVPPADRLKELEWMVGDWVDESATHGRLDRPLGRQSGVPRAGFHRPGRGREGD